MAIFNLKNSKSNRCFLWRPIGMIAILLLMFSCYPNGPDSEEDLNLVATAFDDQFDFDTVNTYLMPDSIVFIVSGNVDEEDIPGQVNQNLILEEIEAQFETIGYQRLANNEDSELADVVVLVSAAIDTEVSLYSSWWRFWGWYNDWDDYPYFYDPGWFYDIPFLFIPFLFEYEVGTLVITMVYPDGSNETTQEIPVVWMGAINGLLTNDIENLNSVRVGLDKMFNQSPYL